MFEIKTHLSNHRLKRPNFFIVGAAKSGTTSLYEYLKQHPEIYMSPVKEPTYFVSGIGIEDYHEYISLFQQAGDAVAIGEASVNYLYDETVPYAINKMFPDSKIIIILRNPIEMAHSYWRHMLIHGSESKSFEEAITEEERKYRRSENFKKSCTSHWTNYLYFERALFFEQVKRYIDIFGRDRVNVYIFERFVKAPERTCQDIFAFLGVNAKFKPIFRIMNEGGELRFQFAKKITNRRYPLLRNVLPADIRFKVREFVSGLNRRRGKRMEVAKETKKEMEGLFREDIKKLESLLGCSIPEWK